MREMTIEERVKYAFLRKDVCALEAAVFECEAGEIKAEMAWQSAMQRKEQRNKDLSQKRVELQEFLATQE